MHRIRGSPRNLPFSTSDPTENVQELFDQLDAKFFQSKLKNNGVLLEWSQKAESAAGYCYQLDDKIRGRKRFYIVLNKPLLMLRSRTDLVETLLHEMIHAVLYIGGIHERNGGHGVRFIQIMNNINKVAGTNITTHHTFHDEVDHCKGVADIGKKEKKVPSPRLKGRTDLKPPKLAQLYQNVRLYGCDGSHALTPLRASQNKMSSRKNILSEIRDVHKAGGGDRRRIKLIGYDNFESDSDSSDSDYVRSPCKNQNEFFTEDLFAGMDDNNMKHWMNQTVLKRS